MINRFCWFALATILSVPARAQQTGPTLVEPQPAATAGATVTGRVVCNDTQSPARFAQVSLIPVNESDDGSGGRTMARTDLDGAFTASPVSAGDYYVTATLTGYVSQQSLLTAAIRAGADVTTLLASLPVVHVPQAGSVTANVTIERGATIAGKVLWDDGSPAMGIGISAFMPSTTTSATQMQRLPQGLGGFAASGFATTDDRGQYRLTGLAPGDYLVRATMPIPSSSNGRPGIGGGAMSSILVYAPGKIRQTDAKPLTLHTAEERDDVLITLDLRSLHTVSGHVSSASDSVTLGSATIRLIDQQDTNLSRTTTIAADGSFTLTYVPSGTYTLNIPYASSSTTSGNFGGTYTGVRGRRGGGNATSFQPITQTLTVTDSDITGMSISLAPSTPSSTN